MVYNRPDGVKRRGLFRQTYSVVRYECVRHSGVLIRKGFRVFFIIVIDKVALVDIDEIPGRKVYGC